VTEQPFPRPSATVVLARESAAGPEIFMVRRHSASAFGAAYAFPGGVLEAADAKVHAWCTGLDDIAASRRLGIRDHGLDYYSAAIRELFEESGILLADTDALEDDMVAARDALNDGADDWDAFVSRNSLPLDCAALHYISHWITPPDRPRRFSTRFFLAELPSGQEASHCGGELTESRWMTAHDALAAGRQETIKLHFPTIKTLESVARHKTLAGLVDWAQSCVEWGVTTMQPMIIERDGRPEIVLPGDKDYPGTLD